MNCLSMDSITEVLYHLNKMLIGTKHFANYCILSGSEEALVRCSGKL